MDHIAEALETLNSSMTTFNMQMKSLAQMNNSIVEFNSNFGAFLSALKATSSCVKFNDPVDLPSMPEIRKTGIATTSSDAKRKTSNAPSGNGSKRFGNKEMVDANLKRILSALPPRYSNSAAHKNGIEAIIRLLLTKLPEGLYAQDIQSSTNILKVKCTEYLNLLVKNGDVIRTSKKGFLYQLNMDKFR